MDALDGKGWVPLDELVAKAGKKVPPGKAMRAAETMRLGAKSGPGGSAAPATRKVPRPPERLIEHGRRYIVRGVVKSARGLRTRRTDEGVVEVIMDAVPPRVDYYRKAEAEGRAVTDPHAFVDRLMSRGTNRKSMLDTLTHAQLVRVADALAERLEQVG